MGWRASPLLPSGSSGTVILAPTKLDESATKRRGFGPDSRSEAPPMPSFARHLLGLLLILATVGVAAWQTLAVSCSSPAAARGGALDVLEMGR